ncbi:MAG: hypothetical protein DDT37_00879 [Firmicutes bacterium]|nr:hypothetical protein [candidate division NPL-UPA2 bacterium]MBT9155905.1 hypothetical protein [candidate division NPL-UPA2 bacterium]
MKEFLSHHNVPSTYIDITSSMANLKAFLKYRDNRVEFAEVRANGRVGIPCTVINDGELIVFGQPELALLQG